MKVPPFLPADDVSAFEIARWENEGGAARALPVMFPLPDPQDLRELEIEQAKPLQGKI